MAGELAPLLDGIKVVADAASRDAVWPLATRPQHARVFRLDTRSYEIWIGSAWTADVPLPGDGRTVTSLTDYLANNATFNVKDYGATGDGETDDTDALIVAISAAAAANGGGGATVLLPAGSYVHTSQLIVPAQVVMRGAGLRSTVLLWNGAAGFGVKLGNTAGVLSYGTGLTDLTLGIGDAALHGVWLYGVADCHLSNLYIEGVPGTTATRAVQIDGADVSAFFVLMQNVHANHVWKGFVHTTTGTIKPTQVTGINCSAFCDNTAGSIGVDVQTVAGVGCGDGVTYLGGNTESCATGVSLNASGTSIIGMRFENPQGTASDVTFGALARNNQILGGSGLFTITDTAQHPSNQVIGVPKDMVASTSQLNRLDATLLSGDVTLQAPSAATDRYIIAEATNDGAVVIQNGPGSGALGGSVLLYGHTHATHAHDVVVGVPNGVFRVNGNALDGGTDWFSVSAVDGYARPYNLQHTGPALAFYGATGAAKPTVTGSRGGNAALASLLTALATLGLLTDSTTA